MIIASGSEEISPEFGFTKRDLVVLISNKFIMAPAPIVPEIVDVVQPKKDTLGLPEVCEAI